MSRSERDVIQAILNIGVELRAPFVWDGGPPGYPTGYPFRSAEEVLAYEKDPNGFEASVFGITLDQLFAFREADGRLRCSGIRKDGSQCKRLLHHEFYADEWVKRSKRVRCPAHKKPRKLAHEA